MNKKLPLVTIAFVFLLAACGQAATPVAQLTPTGAPTQGGGSPTAFIPTSGPAFCVAQTGVFPTPDPTLQAAFPPPAEGDWVSGEASAKLTIIEYSDFQ
ncbi:MAG: hypothetical protein HPY59_00200 [Anaerolineae bacterium]|nr:hypothetical protein [Anaerolineae bacterium]